MFDLSPLISSRSRSGRVSPYESEPKALIDLCLGVIFVDTLGFDMLDRDCASEQSQPSFSLTAFA